MSERSLSKILGTEDGAFDLPSIITGIVAVGILVAGVLATVFGAITFAQDNVTKQDLASIITAQGVSKAKDGAFTDQSGLLSSGYASSVPNSAVIQSDGGSFCASMTSGSGSRFRVTSEVHDPQSGSCMKVTTWTKTSLPTGNWLSSAVSQDGRTMIAVGEYAAKLSSDRPITNNGTRCGANGFGLVDWA